MVLRGSGSEGVLFVMLEEGTKLFEDRKVKVKVKVDGEEEGSTWKKNFRRGKAGKVTTALNSPSACREAGFTSLVTTGAEFPRKVELLRFQGHDLEKQTLLKERFPF